MTDQERPVEERNELLDDLLNAASVVVEEPEASKQESSAADEQPESAAQPAAAPVAEVTRVETAPTATTEGRIPAPVAEVSQAGEPAVDAEADAAPSGAEALAVSPEPPSAETEATA